MTNAGPLPGNKDKEHLKSYAGRFPDGAPTSWKVSYAANSWSVTFPNGVCKGMPVPSSPAKWDEAADVDAASTILWWRSLRYLPSLGRGGVIAWIDIESILNAFNEWMARRGEDRISLVSGSLDHQIALRLRAMCTLRSLLADSSLSVQTASRLEKAIALRVREDLEIVEEFDLFAPNNHGIMLAIGVLHATAVFPDVVAADVAGVWVRKLDSALSEIVDEQGLVPENTVSYQIFYVTLLEQILDFGRWADVAGLYGGHIHELYLRARSAVERLLLPNGAVPPLGDSAGGMQNTYSAREGVLWSPSNGIYVSSDGVDYLLVKAGYRGVIHKQMDDGSFIGWWNGIFLVNDGGLVSYDRGDPEALALRGQRGHSGVFLRRFDGMDASAVVSYSKNLSRIGGQLCSHSFGLGGPRVVARVSYDGVDCFERTVCRPAGGHITVADRYLGSEPEAVVIRFVLDPRAKLESATATCVSFVVEGCRVKYTFGKAGEIESGDWHVRLGSLMIAAGPYRKTAAPCIEVLGVAEPGCQLPSCDVRAEP